MTKAESFAKLLDEYAKRVLHDEDRYALALTGQFQDFALAFKYENAELADRVRWDISELADAPSGPRSMELCLSTLGSFATDWVALVDRRDEAMQREFFTMWIEKAQALLSGPTAAARLPEATNLSKASAQSSRQIEPRSARPGRN